MSDIITEVIEKHGLKNNAFNRIWLRATFVVTFIVTLPFEVVKAIFKS
jgi:hypothetical protein